MFGGADTEKMPVVKIPIVHKFGIISHSQRIELQERLLRQNYDKEKAASKSTRSTFNPLEVCEKFVQKYTNAKLDQRDQLRAEADRMLTHCKRRSGISSQGEGTRVDLPMAWSELAILAQCKGKLQEDCLDILCKSLNHAPVHEENIATLFFLAESVLYWLRTDSVTSSHLRTAEIRLLKLGFLVFVRLYCHHILNNLSGLEDFKTRLRTYLEGIKEHEALYRSYPSVLLSLRFIAKIGDVITATKTPATHGHSSPMHDSASQIGIPLKPIAFKALQVWHCKDKGVGLKRALLDILLSAKDLSEEDWIDSLFAISILGDAAKSNIIICRTLQDITRGVTVPMTNVYTPATVDGTSPRRRGVSGNETADEKKETRGEVFQNIMNGMIADLDSAIGKRPNASPRKPENRNMSIPDTSEHEQLDDLPTTAKSQLPGTSLATMTTGANRGSLPTNPDTPKTDMSGQERIGISSWSWEVAFQYTQILTDICLHGANADIQKMALLGKWLGADVTTFRAGAPNFCIESCGLVDLLEYRNSKDFIQSSINAPSETEEDWSWQVRYGALSGLLHITHALKEDSLKEGMRSAAWSLIIAIQNSSESEDRVLEALRAGQVEYPYFNKTNGNSTSMNIWSRISYTLIEHFLVPTLPLPRSPSSLAQQSPLPPPGSRQSSRHYPLRKITPQPNPPKPTQSSPRRSCPNRTTLKEHLTIPTNVDAISFDYHLRNSLNLSRIVEDQWRKHMMIEHENEEKERIRELQVKQKEEEQHIAEIVEGRKEKLRGKPTQSLGPYEIPNSNRGNSQNSNPE